MRMITCKLRPRVQNHSKFRTEIVRLICIYYNNTNWCWMIMQMFIISKSERDNMMLNSWMKHSNETDNDTSYYFGNISVHIFICMLKKMNDRMKIHPFKTRLNIQKDRLILDSETPLKHIASSSAFLRCAQFTILLINQNSLTKGQQIYHILYNSYSRWSNQSADDLSSKF